MGGEYASRDGGARCKSTNVDGGHEINGNLALAMHTSMSDLSPHYVDMADWSRSLFRRRVLFWFCGSFGCQPLVLSLLEAASDFYSSYWACMLRLPCGRMR